MISDDGSAVLCDYSLAAIFTECGTFRQQTMSSPGTQRWIAPELLEEDARFTTASDVWAYGCLVVEVRSRQTVPSNLTRLT